MAPIPGLLADADFSTRQFYVVKLVGTTGVEWEVTPTTAITDRAIGIIQNDPSTGQAAQVAGLGEIAKAQYGGTVTNGQWLGFGTDARVVASADPTTASGALRTIIAQALEDGATGENHYVLVLSPWQATTT